MLSLTVLGLGFLHGLGLDHLMAIAALSAGTSAEAPRYRYAFGVACRFAMGHAVLLAVGASVVLILGWNIPVIVERGGETLGGLLLIGLGGTALWAAWTRRVWVHRHAHAHHPDAPLHSHWHLHLGREHRHPVPGGHSALPGVLGSVFAVSGLRALTLLLPFETVGDSLAGLLVLVLIFATGILLSMSLFGIVLARVMRSSRLTGAVAEAAALVTAAGSIALGVYWVARQFS